MRRSLLIATLALGTLAALAAPSLAVGPQAAADPGTARISDRHGTTYVVDPGPTTSIRAMRGGHVVAQTQLDGRYGIPQITINSTHGGLSPDGRTLVLATVDLNGTATSTGFAVMPTSLATPAHIITLRGDWTFDAISPDGRVMYLIQRLPSKALESYRVRSYDLAANRLLPHVIADRDDPHGMAGYPVSRVVKGNGRMVFTLYSSVEGTSFVHALDAAKGTAHCIDLPWKRQTNGSLFSFRVVLSPDQRLLRILDTAGGTVAKIDARTLKVTQAVTRP